MLSILIFSNADQANNRDDKISTIAYIVYIDGNAIP